VRVGLVIVAAGSSRRMQGTEKIWTRLGDRPVLWHAVNALAPLADTTVLVVRADCAQRAEQEIASIPFDIQIRAGGAHRHESVMRGVSALDDVDVIAVHDGARPFASARLFTRGLQMLDKFAGVVPVVPLRDTIKRVDEGMVSLTIDRSSLRAAQTPQLFNSGPLRAAQSKLDPESIPTDEAVLMEQSGYSIGVFPGDPWNLKITEPFDLLLARAIVDLDRS